MRIFLNPGHCPGIDSGAVNRNWNFAEAQKAAELAELVRDKLTARGHTVIVEQSDNLAGEAPYSYAGSVCDLANKSWADVFVSLHFNAYNGAATGTETYYYIGSKQGQRLAQCLQARMVEALGLADRGCKPSQGLSVLKHTTMPAVLLEPLFVDNDQDAQLLHTSLNSLAYAIVLGMEDYSKAVK